MNALTSLNPQELDQLARKRTGAKLGWYAHASVFVLVNLFVFSLSEYAFGTRAWSIKPLLGWGLGLCLHGIAVWFLGAGGNLRERLVQRERLQREQDKR